MQKNYSEEQQMKGLNENVKHEINYILSILLGH